MSGRLIIDETKTDASDAVVPLPKITRAVLIEHQGHQATVREDAGELWTDHEAYAELHGNKVDNCVAAAQRGDREFRPPVLHKTLGLVAISVRGM